MKNNLDLLKALNTLKNMDTKELQKSLSYLNNTLTNEDKQKILNQIQSSNPKN